jgi:hypothetical protein
VKFTKIISKFIKCNLVKTEQMDFESRKLVTKQVYQIIKPSTVCHRVPFRGTLRMSHPLLQS